MKQAATRAASTVHDPLLRSNASLVRQLLRITKDYLWFALVKKYFPGYADVFLTQRNFRHPELLAVASKDERTERFIRVRFVKVQERGLSWGACSVVPGYDASAHCSVLSDVARCFLGIERSRLG